MDVYRLTWKKLKKLFLVDAVLAAHKSFHFKLKELV